MSGTACLVGGNASDFLLGGNCTAIIESSKSNKSFTYKIVVRKEDRNKTSGTRLYFVNLAYEYMQFRYGGVLKVNLDTNEIVYSKGKKGSCESDSPSILGLLWVLKRGLVGVSTQGMNVYHLGTCARCGRELTDPDSIRLGLGPTCRTMVRKRKR